MNEYPNYNSEHEQLLTPPVVAQAPAPRQTKKYGWVPDLPDHRDLRWAPAKTKRGTLPKLPNRVDLRETGFEPPIYDQDALGSCTANGVGGAFEYTQRRLGYTDYMPGRLFIYYEERRIIDTLGYDSGAFIRDGLRVVNKLGAPHETLWPYDISRFTQAPPQGAYADGQNHLATAYMSVDNKREFDVKQALAAGLPVVFGFTVFPWFESPDAGGFCRPVLGQSILGGHCTVIVGYFKIKNVWWAIIRNSWGAGWGQSGYCYMPLRWICNYANADDFWVIQEVEPDQLSKLKAAAAKRMKVLVNDSAPVN